MSVTFADIVKDAPGIGALVASLTFLVGVVTFVKTVAEYMRQNSMKRFEKYQELSTDWFEDKDIQKIIGLLDSDPHHALRDLPIRQKEAFVGFYEEIALMFESGLLKKTIAFYMFGYYTIRCNESEDFWANLDKQNPYWTLFLRFAKTMKQIEVDVLTGREQLENWKFRF